MKVVGFCGWSNSGKTTIVEQLIGRLRAAGQRVSVIKHAHHDFDIDHPGKDSYRHRQAGAFEVVIASSRRLALMREFEQPTEPTAHDLIAELSDTGEDDFWVLVEGFKHGDLPKLEVWRAGQERPVLYPHDPFVVAIATDDAATLPVATTLPVLDLNDAQAITAFLLHTAHRYDYVRPEAAADAR